MYDTTDPGRLLPENLLPIYQISKHATKSDLFLTTQNVF